MVIFFAFIRLSLLCQFFNNVLGKWHNSAHLLKRQTFGSLNDIIKKCEGFLEAWAEEALDKYDPWSQEFRINCGIDYTPEKQTMCYSITDNIRNVFETYARKTVRNTSVCADGLLNYCRFIYEDHLPDKLRSKKFLNRQMEPTDPREFCMYIVEGARDVTNWTKEHINKNLLILPAFCSKSYYRHTPYVCICSILIGFTQRDYYKEFMEQYSYLKTTICENKSLSSSTATTTTTTTTSSTPTTPVTIHIREDFTTDEDKGKIIEINFCLIIFIIFSSFLQNS